MALTFVDYAEGIRVFNGPNMLAFVRNKDSIATMPGSPVLTKDEAGNPKAAIDPYGAVRFEPLPRAQCTIHSAVGELPVGVIEEILKHLPNE
jgi:hypothetical protein